MKIMVQKIELFDFDDTLFRSPKRTPDNLQKYEKAIGIPWIIDKDKSRELSAKLGRHVPVRSGWYGKAETLEPPLVPRPAPLSMFLPTCYRFLLSKNNPEVFTLLLTGRHVGIAQAVLRILRDGDLITASQIQNRHAPDNVAIWFKGEKGPLPNTTKQPSETFPWKMWIVEQYASLFPQIDVIEVWEDREEHVTAFQNDLPELFNFVTVNHVQN